MPKIILLIVVSLGITYFNLSDSKPDQKIIPLALKVDGPQSKKSPKDLDAFSFEKSVRVKFHFQESPFEETLKGKLLLDWEGSADKKIAVVSAVLDGQDSHVFIKAHFTDNYQLSCVEFPEVNNEVDANYVQLLKSLVLDYAFKTNQDDNGPYKAKIQTNNETPGRKIVTKTKFRYLDKQELQVMRSKHSFELEDELKHAKGEEHINVKGALTIISYRLDRLGKVDKSVHKRNLAFTDCISDYSQQITFLKKPTKKEFKASLHRLEQADRDGRHLYMREVLKNLKDSPEHLTDYLAWTRSIRKKRGLSAIAIGILGKLGTPEAQQGLIDLYESAGAVDHIQEQVLNAFTLTAAAATIETREFLRSQITEESGHLSEGAAYALGSSIQNAPADPESKRDLDFLLDSLEKSESIPTKMVFLDALGNSASSEAAPTLERYSYSEDKFLREKALIGLRALQARDI